MVGLVAVIVSDLVPPREVAPWRSYVNIVATLGRSCGGPIGGVLVDSIGWRWCFLGQAPIAALAVLLIVWRLPAIDTDGDDSNRSFKHRLLRLDLAGFVTLPVALVAAFLALDWAGKLYPWYYYTPLGVAAVLLFVLFYFIEKHYASEPIVPMGLISRRDVWVPFLVIGLQTSAQFIVRPNICFQLIYTMDGS